MSAEAEHDDEEVRQHIRECVRDKLGDDSLTYFKATHLARDTTYSLRRVAYLVPKTEIDGIEIEKWGGGRRTTWCASKGDAQ